MQESFRIGLVQMSCSLDPNENLAKAEWKVREAAARGAQVICLQELFRSQYFCREENAELFALAESIPGPSTEALGKLARELKVVIVASLFERRAAGLYHNTAAVLGADGEIAGTVPQDAHPRRSALLREVLLHARRSGLPQFRHAVRPHWASWSAGTSGIRKARALPRSSGADLLVYPTAIGWHPSEKAQYGAAQLRCVANHPALARHRQRNLCRGGESRRLRRAARARAGVLGIVFRRRPFRPGDRARLPRTRKKS